MSGKKKHKYEYRTNLHSEEAAAKVTRFVGEKKRVLEVGTGPGSITRLLYEHGGCVITGLDYDSEAINKVSPYCQEVYQCNLNDHRWAKVVEGIGPYQVIVAADVLEHLWDPLRVLKEMGNLLAKDGCLVVSLPHVGHNAIVACMVDEDFSYQDFGLLDKTHIRFFGIKNIQKLFEDAGYKIVQAEFVVKAPEWTEFGNKWRKLSKELKQALQCNPYGEVYQVVLKAVLASSPGKAVKLFGMPVPSSAIKLPENATLKQHIIYRIRKLLLPYMSLRTRNALNQFLEWLGIRV